MFKFNRNPKLSTKGMILMGIPLVAQIISVIFLNNMLEEAEQETAKVQRSRAITIEALTLATTVYDVEYTLYQNLEELRVTGSHNSYLAQEYEKRCVEIPQHLERLQRLVADSPEQKRIVQHFIKSSNVLLKIMESINENLKEDNLQTVFSLGVIMSGGQGPLKYMSNDINRLTAQTTQQSQLEASATKRRQSVQNALSASAVINIFLVTGLFIIFSRGTISRLNVVVDNTKRFASKKPLHAELEGGDEIAQLDRAFHEMSDAVEAANAREQQLMEMKRQLMAMVSHDLRAPLTSLQMTLNLLNKNVYGELSDKAQERVDSSEKNVQRLIRMINDLLDLEKLEAGKMDMHISDVPLPVVVERSIESVSEWADKKQITFDYDAKELEVKGDGDRLIQVLVNLLSNAIKYSPDGASVRIRSSLLNDQMVELQVIDAGPGVPEQHRKQIFERYRQIEDSEDHKGKGGTGLGLAICKIIVEQHQGTVGVEPAEGGGSCFWLRLPAAVWEDDEAEVAEGQMADVSSPLGS